MVRRAIALILAFTMILPPFFVSSQGQDNELILRVAMQDDMKGLNPFTVSDVWSWEMLQWIYERPILVDYYSKEIMPYIAIGSANLIGKAESWDDCAIGNFGYSPQSSWANSSKQEAIIFYDFENVYWHDDVQMDIRDILFSMHVAGQVPEWSSSMNPLKDNGGGTGSNYSSTSWLHVYKAWESADKLQAALKFELQEPYADFFRTTFSILLLPEHIWNSPISSQPANAKIWCDPDYSVNAADAWKVSAAQSYDNNPPIGCGIFKFEFWEKGQMSKINTYREHFYGSDYAYKSYIESHFPNQMVKQPNIDAITFKIFKTAEAAVLAIKSNDVDYMAWSIPPSFVQSLANEPSVALTQSAEQGFYYLGYNMRRQSFGYNESKSFPYAPEDDLGKPLRRAIAHCIDKNRIVTRLLLNLGMPGEGPVSSISPWYNKTIPRYSFDPSESKKVLAGAGYKVNASGVLLSGDDAIAAANSINFWVNPDGSQIGRGPGGQIEILTPEGNYDPIRYQVGQMIASQLREIGINARSVSWDFGIIIDILQDRDFDIYILGYNIGTDPAEYLHSIFDYDFTNSGDYIPSNTHNYPGYQNQTFFNLIDLARKTGNLDEKKQAIFEAQASICYDLPIDVLYYRTYILAYRSDRFTGWITQGGSIFNRDSIVNIRGSYLYILHAMFDSAPSAVLSNSTTQLVVLIKGKDGSTMENASVTINATIGKLNSMGGITGINGRLNVIFTAPYVPSTPENIKNGIMAFIQITSATCDSWEYSPAVPRYILIWVYPEEAKFLSLRISADPDIIDDLGADRVTPGFTNVVVEVTDQGALKVPNARVNLSCSSSAVEIEPNEAIADMEGKATFRVMATNLSDDDGTVDEFILKAQAITTGAMVMRAQNYFTLHVLDVSPESIAGQPTPFPGVITVTVVIILASVMCGVIFRRKRQ